MWIVLKQEWLRYHRCTSVLINGRWLLFLGHEHMSSDRIASCFNSTRWSVGHCNYNCLQNLQMVAIYNIFTYSCKQYVCKLGVPKIQSIHFLPEIRHWARDFEAPNNSKHPSIGGYISVWELENWLFVVPAGFLFFALELKALIT